MKDFQKRTMWVLLAAAMLTACGKDDDTNYDNGRIELRTGIEALTCSPQLDGTGAGNFQAGDVFTLTLSDGSKSVQKTYTVGSTTLYWQELEVTGDEVAFAGCYPHYAADGARPSLSMSRKPSMTTCCWRLRCRQQGAPQRLRCRSAMPCTSSWCNTPPTAPIPRNG